MLSVEILIEIIYESKKYIEKVSYILICRYIISNRVVNIRGKPLKYRPLNIWKLWTILLKIK